MLTSARFLSRLVMIAAIPVLLLAACQGGADMAAPAPQASTPAPTPQAPQGPVAAQTTYGAQVFASVCASCHGASGEGSTVAPALVGATALPTQPRAGAKVRTGRFQTAMDIGMFIKGSMPPGGPQRSMDEMKAVLAYLLQSNGVQLTQPISPAVAGTIPWSR